MLTFLEKAHLVVALAPLENLLSIPRVRRDTLRLPERYHALPADWLDAIAIECVHGFARIGGGDLVKPVNQQWLALLACLVPATHILGRPRARVFVGVVTVPLLVLWAIQGQACPAAS